MKTIFVLSNNVFAFYGCVIEVNAALTFSNDFFTFYIRIFNIFATCFFYRYRHCCRIC